MKRIVLGAWVVTSLAACEEPTQPAAPTIASAAAVAAEELFTVKDLGTLGGTFSVAEGINEQNEVVGFSDLSTGDYQAFLWRPGHGMRSLGTLGGHNSFAQSINDRSEVVGGSERPGSSVTRAFLWSEAGGVRGLGTLGGRNSFANAINNRREVVGVSENQNGRPRAFLWRPHRGMRSLGTLGGGESRAFDVNDATQVVGVSRTADRSDHAFLWTAARGMEDLGTLGGRVSVALGISQTGVVVGFSATDAAGAEGSVPVDPGRGDAEPGHSGRPVLQPCLQRQRPPAGRGHELARRPALHQPCGLPLDSGRRHAAPTPASAPRRRGSQLPE